MYFKYSSSDIQLRGWQGSWPRARLWVIRWKGRIMALERAWLGSWWRRVEEETSGRGDEGAAEGILVRGRRTECSERLLIDRWYFECLSHSNQSSKSFEVCLSFSFVNIVLHFPKCRLSVTLKIAALACRKEWRAAAQMRELIFSVWVQSIK